MKATVTPNGYVYRDQAPTFPSLLRGFPALEMRPQFCNDYWLTGAPL